MIRASGRCGVYVLLISRLVFLGHLIRELDLTMERLAGDEDGTS